MKDPKEFLDSFPELRELIEEAAAKIKEIDEQIKQLRKDNAPGPRYTPKGGPPQRPQGTYAHNKSILENLKYTVKTVCTENVNNLIVHAEAEKRGVVQEYMSSRFNPEPEQQKQRSFSITEKLMDRLPSSKIENANQYKQDRQKQPETPEQNAKEFSIAKAMMDSLPSSKVVMHEKFMDNVKDLNKDAPNLEKE